MKLNHADIIKYLIRLACITTAIVLVGMWLQRYFLDKDSSVLENRYYFDTNDDLFPVMSLCFKQSFRDKTFKILGKNISGSNYNEFLFGRYFSDDMLNVNYDQVSTNISDFILSYVVEFRNGTQVSTLKNIAWKKPYHSFTWNSWGSLVKCFGFEITDPNFFFMRVYLKREIFENRIRYNDGGFAVLFHYPNQVLASMQTVKRQWVKRDNATNHHMSFNLKGMDVNIRRYKKGEHNCIHNWKNYDNITLQRHLDYVGCKTPDLITNDTWPICTNKEKMHKARLKLNSQNLEPCRGVESVDYDMGESEELEDAPKGKHFHGQYWEDWIIIIFRILNPRFKVILQKKDVDFQTLIGYVGGYIGIFTGFAIAQLPDLMLTALLFAKKWYLSSQHGTNKLDVQAAVQLN